MYIYTYKEKDYYYYELIKLPDFRNVSFPKDESKLTDEALAKFGITRTIYEPMLDEVKEQKKAELTACRDEEETFNVITDKGEFEFDTLSQSRLTHAMNAMNDLQTREWTTVDKVVVTMYKADFQNIFATASVRSDTNFAKLNTLKAQVNACTTKEEVNAISWGE